MDQDELTRRVHLLKSQMKEGTIKWAPQVVEEMWESLQRITVDASGQVNPDTVDGRVRAILSFVANQANRDEVKQANSLREIQEAYFQGIEYFFGQPFALMLEAGGDPFSFSQFLFSEEEQVKAHCDNIDDFVEGILEFWEQASDAAWTHLEDSLDTKAVFTGELFPNQFSNIACSTGIYFDTTVLPCPFVQISPLLRTLEPKERCTQVLRLALQVMLYRDLALADLETPIIAILPGRHHVDGSYQDFVNERASVDTLRHAARLFGRDFSERGELLEYLNSFPSSGDLVGALLKPEEFAFATEWEGSLEEQIPRYISEHSNALGIDTPGGAVFINMISRFTQAQDAFQRSLDLGGTPVIRAETSWLWFNWMLRNNSSVPVPGTLKNLHISRALGSSVPSDISWLGNVPPKALVAIRQQGALEEIRSILGKGISEISEATSESFLRTGDLVCNNLQKAFLDHESKLKELRGKKWTFADKQLSSFIVVGGIELTAAVTGIPLFGAAATLMGLAGINPSVKELKEGLSEINKERDEVNNTGVGILFAHRDG